MQPDALPLMAVLTKELSFIGISKTIYSVYSSHAEDVVKILGREGEKVVYSYPDIGEQDAHDYFITTAAKLLIGAVSGCNDDTNCVREKLISTNSFDSKVSWKEKQSLRLVDLANFDLPFV